MEPKVTVRDRRSAPRQRALVELYGRTVPQGVLIRLLNISPTGMALRTELPLARDIEHCFELKLLDRSTVQLVGEITRRTPGPGDWFTIGVRFTKPSTVAAVFDRIIMGATAGVVSLGAPRSQRQWPRDDRVLRDRRARLRRTPP